MKKANKKKPASGVSILFTKPKQKEKNKEGRKVKQGHAKKLLSRAEKGNKKLLLLLPVLAKEL